MSDLKIELPDDERGLSAETIARITRLQERANNPRLGKEQRTAARQELARLEHSRQAILDQNWRAATTAETVALAHARGEEVEMMKSGSVRMKTRDGLQSALEVKDGLSPEQYDAGKAFREAWESRSGDIGSQLGNEGGGGGHQNDRFVRERLTRAKNLQRLGAIERAVALECIDQPVCLQMLRAVAGEGISISAFGEGRAFARNLAALKRALDIAVSFKS
jgi:hypothetical protein